ncbi:type I restriction endonuclease [Hydromonas duriensis]|uniref:Type I restriction enzyme R protein N-terminal domain-containing protein n=1 Tax=Hydromonas duriensis TaxID=1527608 RepID=A0A4R6Y9A4_9BURK|nr:type I restriction endonuclease [Hydromonas duriensis]TDR32017.1 hypothetical protein DFR44_10680 [Hydromonas duriensis]
MDLIDKLKEISSRVEKQKAFIQTEEASKTAFVLPFLQSLGYEIFNPTEVIPEFTADTANKNGEKVDYAIALDEKIIILIECKQVGAILQEKHAGQLYRYFSVLPETKFAILTDGIKYLFYSDLEKEHVMDEAPFFEFDLTNFNESQVDELKKFSKSAFNLDEIISNASNLKYLRALKAEISKEFEQPSEELVRLLTKRVYSGTFTEKVRDQFSRLVKLTLKNHIKESINSRLETAYQLDSDRSSGIDLEKQSANLDLEENNNEIVTTEDELEAYRIIKSIASEATQASRVYLRDSKSYCAIILDDNNRKTICRLHFGKTKRSITVFTPDKEERFELDTLDAIYSHKDMLLSSIKQYDEKIS